MIQLNAKTRASSLIGAIATAAVALSFAGCNGANSSSAGGTACNLATGSHMVNHETGAVSSTGATALGVRTLSGHLPKAVSLAQDQGAIADEQELPVTVSLDLNNQDELVQELADIYSPTSVKFHKFMQPSEFRAKYGPTDEQRAQVKAYLQNQGLHSITENENGTLIKAVGSARALGSAFGTEIHQYQDAQGHAFRSLSNEPQVPASLSIQGVHGLHDLIHAHTHLRQMSSASASTSAAQKHAATGQGGGFSPTDIREAYNVPSAPDASGQTLAVFELDGYTASDITGYESEYKLPSMPLQNVLVGSATGSAGGGAAEVTLDIELMIALAPNASKILVYEGVNDDQGMLDTYGKIASDNLAQSISTSWGDAETGATSSFLQSENTIFMQMAAQGQTIYSAAGDSGADDNGSSLSVDDPSSQPYVVAVGGTSLTTSSTGARSAETTWDDSSGGGGGGISTVWSIPTWQQGLATTANKASSTMRNIPDVSLNADIDTGYSIYYQGAWSVWGGTSCAAPLWAAFNALVNHARAANGLSAIGYITPSLYQIGKSSSYSSDFFDIADSSTNGYYPAVSGYDDATGWGTFNASNLLKDLSADTGVVTATQGASNSCST
jgi:kumamolisin